MKQGFKACVCAVVLCAELFAAGALSAYAAQEQPLPDSGMTLDTAELTLDITEGDPAPVAYLNVQAPNDYFFLIWTSSDPAVASVDGTGKVTGHAEGTAAVTARNERGEKTTCTITVRKSTASRLVLNTSDLTLTITEQEPAPTKQLKLEQNKGGFTYVRQWVSSNPAVASVSTNGTVKAQGSGKAVISALTTAGQVLRCTVTVTSEIGRVQMSKNAMLLQAVGASQKLTAQAAGAKNGTMTWISSNPGVATVSADGMVTAVGDGETMILAVTPEGRADACYVAVGVAVPLGGRACRNADPDRPAALFGWKVKRKMGAFCAAGCSHFFKTRWAERSSFPGQTTPSAGPCSRAHRPAETGPVRRAAAPIQGRCAACRKKDPLFCVSSRCPLFAVLGHPMRRRHRLCNRPGCGTIKP